MRQLIMLSLTTTASCFLTGWHVEGTTSQWEKHCCCSTVEHKSLLTSSRRRQANWCSAGVETKATVMSFPGHEGLHGGMSPPTLISLCTLPSCPLPSHSPTTTPLLTQCLNGNWNTECVYDCSYDKEWYCSPWPEALWSRLMKSSPSQLPTTFPRIPCCNNWVVTQPIRCQGCAEASLLFLFLRCMPC